MKRRDRNTAKDCFNKGSREELHCASEECPCPDAELSQRADDVETLFGNTARVQPNANAKMT